MTHLLVTNDFPPKVGGIQNYLFDLWRRLPPDRFAVLTIDHPDAAAFDAAQAFRIERIATKMLLPTPSIRRRIDRFAREVGARAVLLDPALPIGQLGPLLELPYGVIIHGAEITVPGRLPLTRQLLARVLRGASLVVAAGEYPLREANRATGGALGASVVIPPGVDIERFVPLTADERSVGRRHFGLPLEGPLVVGMSRLVPRKGFDVLIEASAALKSAGSALTVAISGGGRDLDRLEKLARKLDAPVHFLGRVPDTELPLLLGTADVYSMLCRTRWLGLEQEGFGIVFLEAAAAGVPQVAGRSGGTADAVVDEVTGLIVDRPGDVVPTTEALRRLLDDTQLRDRLGVAARQRVVESFGPQQLADRLDVALLAFEDGP